MSRIINFNNKDNSSAVNPLDCTPLVDYVSIIDTTAVGSSRVLKEINGAGYLDYALIACSNLDQSGYIQISIDNVIIVKSGITGVSTSAPFFSYGFINSNVASSYSNGYYTIPYSSVFYTALSAVYYRDLSSSASTMKNLALSRPLYFNTHLKIEFISNSATSKNLIYIDGGAYK